MMHHAYAAWVELKKIDSFLFNDRGSLQKKKKINKRTDRIILCSSRHDHIIWLTAVIIKSWI